MKQIILFIALSLSVMVNAQESESPVDKLFNKYANKDGFTTVNISGALLNWMGDTEKSDDDKVTHLLSKLSGIRILSVEDSVLNTKLNFYKELEADGFFKNNHYESLLEVTEKDEVVRLYVRKGKDGKFAEMLLVVGGDDNALISIRGSINPNEIAKIAKQVNVDVQ